MDLEKFEQFKRKFDPSYANKGQGSSSSNQGPSIKWPSSNVPGSSNRAQNNEDDDLYSWFDLNMK